MELRKVSICTTLHCALNPLEAQKFKMKSQSDWSHRITDKLQELTPIVYFGFISTSLTGIYACHSSPNHPHANLWIAPIGFAFFTLICCQELFKRAVVFRNEYYNQAHRTNIKKDLMISLFRYNQMIFKTRSG